MALEFTDDQAAALLDALGLPADTTDGRLVLDKVTAGYALRADLLVALGLPADTDDDKLVIETAKDLAAQAEGVDPAKPSTVAAAAKRNGMEVLDKATADALRHDAQEGRRLAAAAAQAKVEASVDDAIGKGKIAPSRRGHWVTLIGADPGMAEVLASIPPETAVPLTELGHSLEPQHREGEHAGPKWFDDF